MTAVETAPQVGVETVAEELTGRFFEATLGALELQTVYLGMKLGFYEELAVPRTVREVAASTGILPRYVQEWLEQQAIAGFVSVDDSADPDQRRFHLSEPQRLALLEEDSPFYAGAMALVGGGCGAVVPRVVQAWREGGGLSFAEYGDDIRLGQGLFNKGGFLGSLVGDWLPAMPTVDHLLGEEGARALDLGCGVGWSGIALAQAYPALVVHGVDSDEASIMDARANAIAANVSDRARFEVRNADDSKLPSSYDVAFFFESLHDMAHPVQALAAVRSALRPGGLVVVMDEKAEEEFAPDGSPYERFLGAGSVLHCLPVGLSEPDSAATGAMFRPDTLRRYAAEAGFSGVEIAPVEHDMMRFYVLSP